MLLARLSSLSTAVARSVKKLNGDTIITWKVGFLYKFACCAGMHYIKNEIIMSLTR